MGYRKKLLWLAVVVAVGAAKTMAAGWTPKKPTPFTNRAAAIQAMNQQRLQSRLAAQPMRQAVPTQALAPPPMPAAPEEAPSNEQANIEEPQYIERPARQRMTAPRQRYRQVRTTAHAQPTPTPVAPTPAQPQPMPEPIVTEEIPFEAYSPCDDGNCADDWDGGCCMPCPQFWGRVEYLLWFTKGMETPALATTSPDGTDVEEAGVLGQPGTRVLFGNEGLNTSVQSGGRFFLGGYFDEDRVEGLEVNYLTLGKQTDRFSGSGDDYEILARPFYDVVEDAQASRLIVYPDLITGNMNVVATTSFQSMEALLRYTAARSACGQTDYYIGYRYGDLRDQLRIHEFTETDDGTFDLTDNFNTRNTFNGVDFGITRIWNRGCGWSWEASARVALGVSTCRVGIDGSTAIDTGDGPETFTGGLLTQATNIGEYKQAEFGSIGEIGLTARKTFCRRWTALVGYRFLYWSDVARAGKQIDTRINTTQIPPDGELEGDPLPKFLFNTESFWAQGLHFGLEYAF